MTVTEFSRATGIDGVRLRYLDQRGKLVPVSRTVNGYRYYNEKQIFDAMELEGKRVVVAYTMSCKSEGLVEESKELVEKVRSIEKNKQVIEINEIWNGTVKDSKLEDIIKLAVKGQVSKIYIRDKKWFIQGKFEEYRHWLNYMGTELISIEKGE